MSLSETSNVTTATGARLSGPRATRVPSRILIILLCLTLVGIGAALFQAVRAERTARGQVELTTEVLAALRQSLRAGVDAETGQRGFLLTDNLAYLGPFSRGSEAWLPAIERLARALEGIATPAQARNVERMRELATAKLDELGRTISFVRSGAREDALALVRTDEGEELMDEFRSLVAQLEDEEETILRSGLEDARLVEARTIPLLGFLGAAVVCLVLLGFWLERRTVRAEVAAREAVEIQRARERSDLLARELNHRVENLFAVILSIVTLSGRGQTDVKAAVSAIRSRIHALSLAHAVSQGQLEAKIVSLREILLATLEPCFAGGGGTGNRVRCR